MTRIVMALALCGLATACGGSESAPERKPAAAAARPDACAAAKKAIADLPVPKDTDGLADYADQAATALEKAGSPGVKPLRDAELASIDAKIGPMQETLLALRDAGGSCGELDAYEKMAPAIYAYGLAAAMRADRRLYLRTKSRAQDDHATAARIDARRQRRIAAALDKLAVPQAIRKQHDRYRTLVQRYAEDSARESRDPAGVLGPEENGVGKRRDRAFRALDRALDKLPGAVG